MKILMINSVCGIRSTGRICIDLAEKYLSEGEEVRIAYGREHIPERYQKIAIRIGSDIDVYRSAMKARFLDNEGFNNKKSTKRFLQWADEYNPDIIWLHNLHGYYINIELLFQWIKQRPMMQVKWTLHDCWAFTGHCACFSAARCEKWEKECRSCKQKQEYPKSIFLDQSSNNYKRKKALFTGISNMTLITPSEWLANLVKRSYLKEYTVQVINNTINTEIFKPTESNFRQKYNLNGKKIVLGVASAWGKNKGLNDFIQLSQILKDKYVVVLVGVNKKQIKELPRSIVTIEKTDNAIELAKIYTAADIFVNPTHQDTYPTVNLEARACGTRVITYNVDGSPESAGNENIVEENDIVGLANKIYELLE